MSTLRILSRMTTFTHFLTMAKDKAGSQSSFFWIIGNVMAKMFQLGLAADDVIKRLTLPERAASLEHPIDIAGAAAFPMTDDFAQSDAFGWFDQRVEMIGHEAPGVEMIGFMLTSKQSGDDEVRAVAACEWTIAVAGVEKLVELAGKGTVILLALEVAEAMQFFRTADLVSAEPGISFTPPVGCDICRDRIRQPRGNEVSHAPLPPVR